MKSQGQGWVISLLVEEGRGWEGGHRLHSEGADPEVTHLSFLVTGTASYHWRAKVVFSW
jgi:hypothetical protein